MMLLHFLIGFFLVGILGSWINSLQKDVGEWLTKVTGSEWYHTIFVITYNIIFILGVLLCL